MADTLLLTKAASLESRIDYRFRDKQLLYDAIVRPGYANEQEQLIKVHSQEALANLGDAAMDLVATERLILNGLDAVGSITQSRICLVNRKRLTQLAAEFGLADHLLMNLGEESVLKDSAILGESLEAVAGALYLDGGVPAVRRFLDRIGFFQIKAD